MKNPQGRKISRSAKVKASSFPGCTTIDMRDHIKPTLRKNPDAIVIHVGTNSLRSSTSVPDCAEEIANLATMIGNESSANLAISGIIPSNISNTRKSVSSDIQTLRSGLKKRGAAEFF